MKKKFVKDEELVTPERYMQNKIEAWDFAIQSLFPYPLGVVSKYVIRHKHKGGKQDLEKALIWAKKAKESCRGIKDSLSFIRICEYFVTQTACIFCKSLLK